MAVSLSRAEFDRALMDLATCWTRKLVSSLEATVADLAARRTA